MAGSAQEQASRLRAAVLGATDGITSTAALVLGVVAAHGSTGAVFLAGGSGLIGGAMSMGGGEYVSVSAEHDAEAADGVSAAELPSGWSAAAASFCSFAVGALVPVLAALLSPAGWRPAATFAAVAAALALTGLASARLGGTSVRKAVLRTLAGGGLAMAATYLFGRLAG